MIRDSRLLPLFFAFLATACANAPPPPAPPPAISAPAPSPPPRRSLEQQVQAVKLKLFILVEEQRHRLNAEARPLALDPQLAAAAQAHSDDMAMKKSFDVMNPNGNPALNALLADPKFRGFVGENSAAQYFTPGVELDADALAKGFLDIWLNSPNHKNNLVFGRFDRTGIGVAVGGDMIYASELFATDLGLPEQ
jgi:uncharacterized protein YkwD